MDLNGLSSTWGMSRSHKYQSPSIPWGISVCGKCSSLSGLAKRSAVEVWHYVQSKRRQSKDNTTFNVHGKNLITSESPVHEVHQYQIWQHESSGSGILPVIALQSPQGIHYPGEPEIVQYYTLSTYTIVHIKTGAYLDNANTHTVCNCSCQTHRTFSRWLSALLRPIITSKSVW